MLKSLQSAWKGVYKFFAPNNFRDNPYGWLTNQIGHTSASFVLCYLPIIPWVYNGDLTWSPIHYIVIAVFWLLWETRQLIDSGDREDYFEDLFYELSGVVLFVSPLPWLYVVIAVIVIQLRERILHSTKQ